MTARRCAWPVTVALAIAGAVSLVPSIAVGASLAAPTAIEAQGNKKGTSKSKDKGKGGPDHAVVTINIDRDGHSRVVREYVTRGNLPPGLAKRRTLPPGLRQQLRENGALPPGLRDYYTPIPADWNSRFPAIPVYYTRYFVGRDLIIIDTRHDTLVSLIRDLLD